MATWQIVLIVIAAVSVVGSLIYVIYRWGKKSTITKIALSGASAVFNVLESVFKDKPDELDAHDFMSAFGELTQAGIEVLKEQEAGKPFDELKDMMRIRIRGVINSFPGMADKVSDEIIEKAVDAFFMLVSSIPKVKDISKK